MKTLLFWIFLIPILAISQENKQENNAKEYLVVGTVVMAPQPDKVQEFKDGIKAHNQQFHAEGAWGVRIYNVLNGPNAEKYMAVMGPFHWSDMDREMADSDAHEKDWNTNVVPYMVPDNNFTFWRFHDDLSNFPDNFAINKLEIVTYDIKRMEGEKTMELLKDITSVMKEKYPELPFGVYTNEFPATKEGTDMGIVYFFDDFKWLSEDPEFSKKYEEVKGQGSFKQLLENWKKVTEGARTEVWIYNQGLSGIGSQVTTGSRTDK